MSKSIVPLSQRIALARLNGMFDASISLRCPGEPDLTELLDEIEAAVARYEALVSTFGLKPVGCAVCGLNNNEPMGYVCSRDGCPTRVTA